MTGKIQANVFTFASALLISTQQSVIGITEASNLGFKLWISSLENHFTVSLTTDLLPASWVQAFCLHLQLSLCVCRCITWPVYVWGICAGSWTSLQTCGGKSGHVLSTLSSTAQSWWRADTSISCCCAAFTSCPKWENKLVTRIRDLNPMMQPVSSLIFAKLDRILQENVCIKEEHQGGKSHCLISLCLILQITKETHFFHDIMKCYRSQPQANSHVGYPSL